MHFHPLLLLLFAYFYFLFVLLLLFKQLLSEAWMLLGIDVRQEKGT